MSIQHNFYKEERWVTVNKEPLLTHAWENWFEKTKNMHTTSGYYLTATLKQNKKKQNYFIWGSNVLKGAVWASQMQWCWTFCDVRGKLSEVFFQGTKKHSNILAVQTSCWHIVHPVHNDKSKAWQTVPNRHWIKMVKMIFLAFSETITNGRWVWAG